MVSEEIEIRDVETNENYKLRFLPNSTYKVRSFYLTTNSRLYSHLIS